VWSTPVISHTQAAHILDLRFFDIKPVSEPSLLCVSKSLLLAFLSAFAGSDPAPRPLFLTSAPQTVSRSDPTKVRPQSRFVFTMSEASAVNKNAGGKRRAQGSEQNQVTDSNLSVPHFQTALNQWFGSLRIR
jgi:hypothetical protein